MTNRIPRAERRPDALSKARIVDAAIEILDAQGDGALTFRALATRLATGSGAIYWHVANKDELLTATTGEIIARVMTGGVTDAPPREAIRAIALGLFDAIDAHPWVGAQLSRAPWQSAMLQIFENVGQRLQAMAVPDADLFNAASALVNYILGVAGQNAANARLAPKDRTRAAVLGEVAAEWAQLDPAQHPFIRKIAAPMADHDDRDQFLAGIDLILAGVATLR